MNGQTFKGINLSRALEILHSNTHISLVVKSNSLGFKEIITLSERAIDVIDASDTKSVLIAGRITKNKLFQVK